MIINESFENNTMLPNFTRDVYDTLESMKNVSKKKMPQMYIALCLEDGKAYLYNKLNEVDQTLGLWRELNISGGSSGSGLSEEQLSHLMFQFSELPSQSTENMPITTGTKAFNLSDGKIYEATVDGNNITWNEVEKVTVGTPTISIANDGTFTVGNITNGATAYYSLDGSEPSIAYDPANPPQAEYGQTVKVKVVKSGISTEATPVTYTVPAPTVNVNNDTGSISITQNAVNGNTYYTTDGTTPTAASTLLDGTPEFDEGQSTVKAITIAENNAESTVASATYTVPAPTVNVDGIGLATITQASSAGTTYYTTDGATPTAASTSYSEPVQLTDGQTIKAITINNGVSSTVAQKNYAEAKLYYYGFINSDSADAVGDLPAITFATLSNAANTKYESEENATNKAVTISPAATSKEENAESASFIFYAYPSNLGNLSTYNNGFGTAPIGGGFTKFVDSGYNIYVQNVGASYSAGQGPTYTFN